MLKKFQKVRQPVSDELRDSILALLRSKFYNGEDRDAETKAFFQDRRLLLKWVVFYPAGWLAEKAVTIHGEAYREIFVKVFIQAAANVRSKVNYRPAYLRQVIQSYFAHHGEDIYNDAKSIRNLTDRLVLLAGQSRAAAPDPVAEFAKARRLIEPPKRKKAVVKTPVNDLLKEQLNLL